MISVAIADSQPLLREGLRRVVESVDDFDVVGEASDGIVLLKLLRAQPVDVVLMDLHMRRMNGVRAAQRLLADEGVLAHGRAPRVVLLTTFDLDDHIAEAAAADVHAVLYKDVPPEVLLAVIREAASSRAEN